MNVQNNILRLVGLAIGIAFLLSCDHDEEKKTQGRVTGFLKLTPGQMEKQLIQKSRAPLPKSLSAYLTDQFPALEVLSLPPMPPGYPLDDPFVCSGDFNGDGLKDFALVLNDKKGLLTVMAFHQKGKESYVPFTLRVMPGIELSETRSGKRIDLTIFCQKPGTFHEMVSDVNSEMPTVTLKNDSIHLQYRAMVSERYFFVDNQYMSFYQGKPQPATESGHDGPVSAVAFSPDGRWLASGSEDRTVRIWEAPSWRAARTFASMAGEVHAVAFSPDSRWIVSGNVNGTLDLWEVTSSRRQPNLLAGEFPVMAVAFSPDGRWLASGTQHDPVKLWRVGSQGEVRDLTDGRLWASCLAFSPDSRLVAVAGSDLKDRLFVVDVATGRLLHNLTGHTGRILAVAFSPDGRRIVSGGHDRTLRFWDAATGREVKTLIAPPEHWISNVALSPNGRWLASASGDKTVKLWDIATGTVLRTFAGHIDIVWALAFSPDGNWLASGSQDSTVRLWEVASGNEVRTLGRPQESILQ